MTTDREVCHDNGQAFCKTSDNGAIEDDAEDENLSNYQFQKE